MMSDCSRRRSSDWRSERIPIVTLSKSIISAALGAWAGGSWCTVRGKWACGGCVMWLRSVPGRRPARAPVASPSRFRSAGTCRRSAPGRALLRHVRSEEHTSELQSQFHLVCRLLLEKKKKIKYKHNINEHRHTQVQKISILPHI